MTLGKYKPLFIIVHRKAQITDTVLTDSFKDKQYIKCKPWVNKVTFRPNVFQI